MDKPLITLAIGCYNQEAYIREAIESAFAQTYSPLEILVTDDCSVDRTFEIVKEMAASYGGPHTIRLNRNERNLGIGGNFNKGVELCRGELVVCAGGDDISMPDRTSAVVAAWNDSGRKAATISSRYVVIDALGRAASNDEHPSLDSAHVRFEQGTFSGFLRRRTPHVIGPAYSFSRKLFTLFGPFVDGVTYEDTALSFRALISGGSFAFIEAPHVKYRRHGANVTFALHQKKPGTLEAFEDFQRKYICELERFVAVYKSFAADAQRAMDLGLLKSTQYSLVQKQIERERQRFELRIRLMRESWWRRCNLFCRLYLGSIRPREMWTQAQHLLPRRVYRSALIAWNKARVAQVNA